MRNRDICRFGRYLTCALLLALVGCATPTAKELGERYQETLAPEDKLAWYEALDREGWKFDTRQRSEVDERGVYKLNREAKLMSLSFRKGFTPAEGAWSEDVGEDGRIDVSWYTKSNGAIVVTKSCPTNWEVYANAYIGEVTRFGFRVMAANTNANNALPKLELPAGWRILEGEEHTGGNFREAFFTIEKDGLKLPPPEVKLTWPSVGVRKIHGVTNEVILGESATFTPSAHKPPTMLRTSVGRWGSVSITHMPNVKGTEAGPHGKVPFPEREIAAGNNFVFALREGFRFFGYEKDGALDARIWLCGFDLNYPNGHTDFPAHFHIGVSARDGTQLNHFYPDAENGRIRSNSYQDMTSPMDVWDRVREYRPGDEWATYDGHGRLVFYVKILEGGFGLRVRMADGSKSFEVRGERPCEEVGVYVREGQGEERMLRRISVSDDPLNGRLVTPDEVIEYDPDTGAKFVDKVAPFRKFVWIELLGFDNTRGDFGVADWLARQKVKPTGVSLLLEDIEMLHSHAGLKKDFPLSDKVCSYDARPGNEERRRQQWTAYQLRDLVAELKRNGLEVYPSFFERGYFDITRAEREGMPYVDFFIRQTLALLKDYGFTGLHAADGFGHPRYGIDTWFRAGYKPDGRKVRFARDETDWRKAAEEWTAFWRKAAHAIKAEGYKLYLNTVWTRDPYEALVRYGEDYSSLCDTEIDGFICESSASVLELEGWNWDEEKTLDKSLAMINRLAACVRGRKELHLLHCIKDGCEQYNALRHSHQRAIAEAIALGGVRIGSKRALQGEMECLADGISKDEWTLLDDTWKLAFTGVDATAEGARVVWSDRALRREAEVMSKLEYASSSTLLAALYNKGAMLGGMIDIKDALNDTSHQLVVLNPAAFPEDELAALKQRKGRLIQLGYGVDEFTVAPKWERKLVWPFPMYEARPDRAAIERCVTEINSRSLIKPLAASEGKVSVMSSVQADGTRFIVLRNLTSVYHTARVQIPADVISARALTADPMLPVEIAADKEGHRVLRAKLPPDGAVLIRTRDL